MEKTLELVRDFADRCHGTQTRKYSPDRYIVHPVRVMELCRQYTQDITVLAAALLHDVLEDTPVTKGEIRAFLLQHMTEAQTDRTVKLVVELTDEYVKADYPQWNRKKRKSMEVERMARTSADAQTVKYADIIDNCSEIVQHDRDFARVFLRECGNLLKVIDRGNKQLYQRAVEMVEKETESLKGGKYGNQGRSS